MLRRYQQDFEILQTNTGTRFYSTNFTSEVPRDIFEFKIISQDGDRFDSLAAQYYKDASKWWIIAKANNLVNGTMMIPGGIQLIIPSAGLL
jgi:hypothetical protein